MKINANRRSFLKGACVGAGVVLSSSFLEAKNDAKAVRDFLLTFRHNMSFETANEIDIWQPLAMSHKFQTPYNLKVLGNYSNYSISNDDYVPLLHAAWRNDSTNKELSVSFNVKSYYTKGSIDMPFASLSSKEDRYIRTDGSIASVAESVAGSLNSDLSKAKKLFEWVATNIPLENAKSVSGIRNIFTNSGDVIMRGEDISASSVFVSLCRASGIEAVESFGLKFDSGRYGVGRDSQELYTRSAIRINDSWIPNDVILAMNVLQDSKQYGAYQNDILNIAFDEWDNNWILFNFARDVNVGTSSNTILSTMQHAHGQVDGTKLDSYNTTHFNTMIA